MQIDMLNLCLLYIMFQDVQCPIHLIKVVFSKIKPAIHNLEIEIKHSFNYRWDNQRLTRHCQILHVA